MPNFSERDDGRQPPIDRLDTHARNLFYEMILNDRRPVAVVGSGLSIIYGGVSWEGSVRLALAHARDEIQKAITRDDRSTPHRLERLKRAVAVFLEEDGLKSPEDKYLALDLCEEALDWLDSLPRTQTNSSGTIDKSAGDISTFRAFMARLYRDDTLFVRMTIIERFALGKDYVKSDRHAKGYNPKVARLRKLLNSLSDNSIHQLACAVYSISFFEKIVSKAGHRKDLADLVSSIGSEIRDLISKGWNINPDIMPIDRRSLICILLGELDVGERYDLIEEKLEEIGFSSSTTMARAELQRVKPVGMTSPPHRPLLDPLRTLQNWFGIRRYITLNFDFELEHNLMLDDIRAIEPRPFGFLDAKANGVLTPDGETGGLFRRYADGLAGSTDIYQQAAVARLFEFALDSADYRAQILHLHGRADLQETMVLTDRDSNRVHRSSRSARTLLEQGLDVVLTGSPILFVGIGLSEPEITRSLRDLVSRGQATANNPTFAIMAIDKQGSTAWRQQLSVFRKYGIHLIAAGLPKDARNSGAGPADVASLAFQLDVLRRLRERVEAGRRDPLDFKAYGLLAEAKCLLPLAARSNPEPWLDHLAFQVLAERICEPHPREIPEWKADSWKDYLEKLTDKLRSLAVLETLRSLRNGFVSYQTERELPATYNGGWQARDKHGKTLRRGLRLRDETIWARLRDGRKPLHDRRHMSIPSRRQVHPKSIVAECARAIAKTAETYVTCFAPLGSGKGSMVRRLESLYRKIKRPTLFINCNFGIEFESVIIHVLVFVSRFTKPPAPNRAQQPNPVPYSPFNERIAQISQALARGGMGWSQRPVIVLSGLERLIDALGNPIAPELDLLLEVLRRPDFRRAGFQLVIVAGSDSRAFVERSPTGNAGASSTWLRHRYDAAWPERRLGDAETGFLGHLVKTAIDSCGPTGASWQDALPARRTLRRMIEYAATRSTEPFAPNSARSPAIEAVLRVVLERWHDLAFDADKLSPINRTRAELDREILTEMIFVGMPIEAAFLLHLDKPREHLATIRRFKGSNRHQAGVDKAEVHLSLRRLAHSGLLVVVTPARGMERRRFAPHRSVLAELRHRLGVRSGDEMLSNTFSLTLALSMPTDLVVAETDIHERLRRSVGRLRGAWKDGDISVFKADLEALRTALVGPKTPPAFDAQALRWEEPLRKLERALLMATTATEATTRAAVAIVRGFFSAASLVAQMPEDRPRPAGSVGEFEAHKQRLGQIVDRFREIQTAEIDATAILKSVTKSFRGTKDFHGVKASAAAVRKLLRDSLKTNRALYGSELVWLINERAVVALLQGDLHEAQRGFREAERANELFRSRKPGISWRRLRINRALLWIERGRIGEARNRLLAIQPEMATNSFRSAREDELCAPLVESYLGYCDYLQGDRQGALTHYGAAIRSLEHDGQQQRALAVTHIRAAELHFTWGETEPGREKIGLGLAIAESGRQMDIMWRARLVQVRGLERATEERRIETIFAEARSYARIMEMPRVAVMALRGEADFKLLIKDLDAAGVLAAEAMTVATRYGMVLERIDLRVLMGTILLRKREPSGRYLLERALEHADRIGYQLAVDRAQEAMLDAKRLDLI